MKYEDTINEPAKYSPFLTERVDRLEERLRLAEAADLGHLELIAQLEKRIALLSKQVYEMRGPKHEPA